MTTYDHPLRMVWHAVNHVADTGHQIYPSETNGHFGFFCESCMLEDAKNTVFLTPFANFGLVPDSHTLFEYLSSPQGRQDFCDELNGAPNGELARVVLMGQLDLISLEAQELRADLHRFIPNRFEREDVV